MGATYRSLLEAPPPRTKKTVGGSLGMMKQMAMMAKKNRDNEERRRSKVSTASTASGGKKLATQNSRNLAEKSRMESKVAILREKQEAEMRERERKERLIEAKREAQKEAARAKFRTSMQKTLSSELAKLKPPADKKSINLALTKVCLPFPHDENLGESLSKLYGALENANAIRADLLNSEKFEQLYTKVAQKEYKPETMQ